jgi:hypothetical protein
VIVASNVKHKLFVSNMVSLKVLVRVTLFRLESKYSMARVQFESALVHVTSNRKVNDQKQRAQFESAKVHGTSN